MRTGFRSVLPAALAAAISVAGLSPGRQVQATFGGSNGNIVFDGSTLSDGLRSVSPSGGDGLPIPKTAGADHPKISPDGKTIVFTGVSNDEVYTIDIAGSRKRHLKKTHHADDPTWDADGKHLIVGLARGGSQQLYRMNANGSKKRRLTNLGTSNSEPDVASDGRIAWKGGSGKQQGIWSMSSDGTNQKLLAAGGFGSPSWSPDGTKIAYTGELGHIWVMKDDGSQKTDVTPSLGGFTDHPQFSPDGNLIVFTSTSSGSAQLWKVLATGAGAPTMLTQNGGFSSTWQRQK